jgi:uncharacterized protein YciI
MSEKYVLFSEPGDDVRSKAPAHFPAHMVRIDEFHGRGALLMVGTFGNRRRRARCLFSPRVKPLKSLPRATLLS